MVYIDEEGFKDSSDLKLQIQSGFFFGSEPKTISLKFCTMWGFH